MAQYTQPSNNDTIYNSNDFLDQNATASLNANNSFSGSLNTFPNASIASLTAGNTTVTGALTANGASIFTGGVSAQNGLSVDNGLGVNSGAINLGGGAGTQTQPIQIGGTGAATGAINIGTGSGSTANIIIGGNSINKIWFYTNPLYPITFFSPVLCNGTLTVSGLITANSGLTVPSGQNLTIPTQLAANNSTLAASTAYVTSAIATAGTNMAMTNATQTFTGANTFSGATTMVTQTAANNSTLAATTAYVTTAVANTTTNMAMTNAANTFTTGLSTFQGGLTTTTNITLPVTYIVPTVNQLGYQIIVGYATTSTLTTNVLFALTSTGLSIPAYGTWLVSYQFMLAVTVQPVTITSFLGGIATTNATTPTWTTAVSSWANHIITQGGMVNFSSNSIVYSSGAVQTLFCNATVTFTTTTGILSCTGTNKSFIQAVRIA